MRFTPARFRAPLASLHEHRFVTSAVLTDTIGAGLTLPLTIVYFTITTDVSLAVIGVLSTVASLVALPIGLVGGVLTDRFGARASMVLNNLLSAAGFTLYLSAHDPVVIFAAFFLANASERLYWTSWITYVHDLAAGRPFERWFAFLEATKAAALGAGAIVAAVTLAHGHQDGLRWLVLANVVTSVAAAVVFATQRTGHRTPQAAAPTGAGPAGASGLLRALRRRPVDASHRARPVPDRPRHAAAERRVQCPVHRAVGHVPSGRTHPVRHRHRPVRTLPAPSPGGSPGDGAGRSSRSAPS
ncbi:MFS transporter [Curtobacterium sp. MCBD17_008]|uniref:MFS transporter n=1 Tax=Curtobacterium sp. MCBD17_008 TaxID=2175656 RepID=UPI000DA943EF|nr:MFS transporter [Curtobacterium sp. MCBD17_008]PZE90082.1 hypothetical protein DEI95_12580 [Curtobacterium sp. MCBD17_008]